MNLALLGIAFRTVGLLLLRRSVERLLDGVAIGIASDQVLVGLGSVSGQDARSSDNVLFVRHVSSILTRGDSWWNLLQTTCSKALRRISTLVAKRAKTPLSMLQSSCGEPSALGGPAHFWEVGAGPGFRRHARICELLKQCYSLSMYYREKVSYGHHFCCR